jgi:hypothetical protein
MCSEDARSISLDYVSEGLNIDINTLSATIKEDDFNDTYGKGEYLVKVTNSTSTVNLTVCLDMVAFSNEDDSEVICEEQNVTIQ